MLQGVLVPKNFFLLLAFSPATFSSPLPRIYALSQLGLDISQISFAAKWGKYTYSFVLLGVSKPLPIKTITRLEAIRENSLCFFILLRSVSIRSQNIWEIPFLLEYIFYPVLLSLSCESALLLSYTHTHTHRSKLFMFLFSSLSVYFPQSTSCHQHIKYFIHYWFLSSP